MNFTWNSHQINFMGYLCTRISLKWFLRLDITKAYHIPFTWKLYTCMNFSHQNIGSVRSDKLKPFWLSMVDEDLSTFNWLCGALMSRELTDEYREAVSRSLDIPDCKVVPFFGGFLRDLRSLFINVPSIIVLPSEENQSLEVNWHDMKILLLWNPLFHFVAAGFGT